ncbi:GNAT family N-acetyltransferase [Azospirillum sp. TSO35-2]|uniref:GNAT family N-acetyltransferase n=1 Tax=Azospirillum sp. TSO35-2 TaxID=716796 RepID=UPI0011B482D4|nr:GNAT family N-acetyltransferase [Azospirillum sp. TSO35-2]
MIEIGRARLPGHDGGPAQDIRLVFLDPSHAGAIAALQAAAIGTMMYPITPSQIVEMLGPRGCTVGVLAGEGAGERLIGFFALLFPGRDPESMGYDFGLRDAELDAVAHWTAVIVHPSFRGHGLQTRMVMAVERLFPQAPVEFGFVTVRTDNWASLRSMLAAGFAISKIAPKFDGWLRYTLFRITPADAPPEAEGCRWVDATDVETQARWLGEGFVGCAFDPSTARLRFARLSPDSVAGRIRARPPHR